MVKVLITSGPTRQYLDPVRYLTNGSSGQMGASLAQAALDLGHQVTIISGPVTIDYPPEATVIWVVSTEEMLAAAEKEFPSCQGAIGVAAPCDYRPTKFSEKKIAKTGEPLLLRLV
ncbi:MAG: phosphopantothenoylcysteine decarboxylase, partial [Pirellulaceae bacterium]|nr:phosphopantothenoylcysteine decarboxylase [Pirellulaceae bacterium]